ncbi:histidine kinase [Tsukamurella sp. 8F]|uniref:sensor histidine kinase n=1 Tax=unclassified Tsukamurella TaxID=2633480 RepID=UPI0023B9782F|nr:MULTISPECIES: histidine kinase [unclassified Tsukamurella]MDF0528810.1 histidine kinase [Tsukamurella sp. 8J]MDF0586645.1 histidine kinase [Tsukamurella sp. 8F]
MTEALLRRAAGAVARRATTDRPTHLLTLAVLAVGGLATVVSLATGEFWFRWVWFGLVIALAAQFALRLAWTARPGAERPLAVHGAIATVMASADFMAWVLSGGGFFWPIFVVATLCATVGTHLWAVSSTAGAGSELAARVETMARGRRRAAADEAVTLQRIERDLHDGPQARLIALSMSAALAEDAVRSDPDEAERLLRDVRGAAATVIEELRSVMRAIRPPVLADRGLVGAVRALALDLPLEVAVDADDTAEVPAAIEPVAYFCIAECLTNVAKHSGAAAARVTIRLADAALTVTVVDDGRGGARVGAGSGLTGLRERLEPFGGTLRVSSPGGGPTTVTITVPTDDGAF